MSRKIIKTTDAPQAIGTYSQAIEIENTVYLSGQIPLVPDTMELVEGDMRIQITRVFENLDAVVKAAGGSLADVVDHEPQLQIPMMYTDHLYPLYQHL